MPNEVNDAIQQHGTVATADAQETQDATHETHESESGQPSHATDGHEIQQSSEPHALEPGGKRFNQIYARAKDAEAKVQQERERAARLEGELEAIRRQQQEKPVQATPARYTESQLQGFVDEGKITVGQALAYQGETIRLETAKMMDQKITDTLESVTKKTTVSQELTKYREAVPDIDKPGTEARQKVEQEFSYLVTMGYDPKDLKTEVLALRAAFGDTKLLKAKQESRILNQGRDTMQDIPASGKPQPDAKDSLKGLTAAQRTHYEKMISKGVYKDWAEVKEEVEWAAKRA